jgi:signal transduction histidine kinase
MALVFSASSTGATSFSVTRQQPTLPGLQRLNSAYLMNRKLITLSQRYTAALRKHLKQGPQASLRRAHGLGRQAVALGLETLDLARIHAEALVTIEASSSSVGIPERAEIFFIEAITPIEETHRAALKAKVRLRQLKERLGRRTLDLAASNQSLKQGIAQRKTAEEALEKRGAHSNKLLKDSLALQNHLQHLTHQILSAQEDKRKEISRDLQDEIAQTLLGINVRLLTLKKEAAFNANGLHKEIASTQRLVDMSAKRLDQFAREFGRHHET